LLDDLGLVPTLRWLADRHAQASEIAIRFDFDQLATRVLPEVELACYRVAQEALTNAIRHAHATQVSIELRTSGQELELTVHDNGVGFDPDDMLARAREGKSIGLLGIQERAKLAGGQVDIRSLPGKGTSIQARFPLGGSSRPGAESA
jgi:signal transduction histidine kinase